MISNELFLSFSKMFPNFLISEDFEKQRREKILTICFDFWSRSVLQSSIFLLTAEIVDYLEANATNDALFFDNVLLLPRLQSFYVIFVAIGFHREQ